MEELLARYNATISHPPTLLREGTDNDMYIIKLNSGDKAVLRLSKRDTSDSIVFETNLLDFLFRHNVSAPRIILTTRGELWTKRAGLPVVCFRFISGETLEVEAKNKPQATYAFTAGSLLGKLHTAGLGFNYNHGERRTIFTEYNRALSQKEKIAHLEEGKKFLKIIESYLDWAKSHKGTVGIIHNDYIPSNLMFHSETSATILDFDWACRGPLIKDLGIALATWSLPDGLEKHWSDTFNAFLDGYNATAPEKIKADATLYKWICFSCLSDACTFFADLPNNNTRITKVMQCRRYKKYLYFAKKL